VNDNFDLRLAIAERARIARRLRVVPLGYVVTVLGVAAVFGGLWWFGEF
jgi:hypothetical protein